MRNLFVTLWVEDEREKYKIYINGEKKGDFIKSLDCTLPISTQDTKLKISGPFSVESCSVTIPSGKDDVIASVELIKPLSSWECSKLKINLSTYKPYKTRDEKAQKHYEYVSYLIEKYLETGSGIYGLELEFLYANTNRYCENNVEGYRGLRAFHALCNAIHTLNKIALYPFLQTDPVDVEAFAGVSRDDFISELIGYYNELQAFKSVSEDDFNSYLFTIDTVQQKEVYPYSLMFLEVYAYPELFIFSDVEAAQWCFDVHQHEYSYRLQEGLKNGKCVIYALKGILYYKYYLKYSNVELYSGMTCLNMCLSYLSDMDGSFKESMIFPFEEDVLCEAYQIYQRFYTDEEFGYELNRGSCYDLEKAKHILKHAYDLIKRPQFKARLQSYID